MGNGKWEVAGFFPLPTPYSPLPTRYFSVSHFSVWLVSVAETTTEARGYNVAGSGQAEVVKAAWAPKSSLREQPTERRPSTGALSYFARNTGDVSRAGNNTRSSIKHAMIVTADSSPKEAIGLKFEKKKIANVAASATLA
jgi:hypothetical protein